MSVSFVKPARAIIVLGQSQATNALGATLYTVRNAGLKQLNINDGTIRQASEPFLGVAGAQSSFMVEMGDTCFDSGRWSQLVIAPIAVSGTYASEWAVGGDQHGRITTIIAQIAVLGLSVGAIVWQQGEADAEDTSIPQASYVANVQNVVGTFRGAGIRAPFFVPCETWANGGFPPNATAIRAAQGQLASSDKRIFAGPDFDTLGNNYRYDTTHFNDAGKSAVAQMWVPFLMLVMH